ncbi:MAG: hypothetical protein UY72_C0029G0004 [Candidatus Uhrbacteria bacterium GW2011_GWD2_52_7]|uniref:Uncharacterized protein n=1 Tax=Candidatus Uhrbacteria bacterium GW2011_GWD2_52_7 TaxID=1618989 RepID=A0A0G1XG35_9BACT|nr:MAG: hypothetical protein UY72_C0029G0004 [Candidatus Uhrbacteria bacterium GW2011_GWD2_52_7]
MDDICIHNGSRSTCYICNGTYFHDRARKRLNGNRKLPVRNTQSRKGRSGKNGVPVQQPPEGTVNVYPNSEASFRKLNVETTHVRIIGMPLASVVDRVLELAPNMHTLYVGVRLELVGAKLQLRLARKNIALIGSSR